MQSNPPSPHYNAEICHFKATETEALHFSSIVTGGGGEFIIFIKHFAHDCLKKSNLLMSNLRCVEKVESVCLLKLLLCDLI